MSMRRTFPKSKVKGIVKQNTKRLNIQKNVDILLFLDYMLFLKRLAQSAELKADEKKDTKITAEHIKEVRRDVLKQCSG